MSDWQPVRQMLIDKFGLKVGKLVANPVSGGDINRAYRLNDGQHQFFVKTNSPDRLMMFEAE
ncbi:MAG: fructosamine kinase family protein, partial [Gammaproteobacteria bacterium]